MFDFSKKIPSLDGIRAVAVVLVLLSHAGYGHLVPGGFGVTLFFFLSGYLIAFLLLKEFEVHGDISCVNFFVRRALRILPPLFIVLVVFYVLDVMLRDHVEYDFGGIFSQLFFYYNYYRVFVDGNVVPGSGVLWSLAVEEHYYAVFPFVFALLFSLKSLPGRMVFAVSMGFVVVIIMLWRIYLYQSLDNAIDRIYFSTDTRIDSILMGAIFSMVFFGKKIGVNAILRFRDYVLLLVALLVILLTFVVRDEFFRWTIRFTIQGLALFVFFYYAVFYSKHSLFKVLNLWPVQVVGVVSYTVYLVHSPLIHILKDAAGMSDGLELVLVSLLLSVLAGLAMYVWVERPLAAIKTKFN